MKSCSVLLAAGSALALAFASSIFAADTNWTDRKEYDLVLTIRSETTPQKRLDLLDKWSKDYPKTALREARMELYLATYQSLGDPAHMFEVSRQILADHPGSPVGLYWCTVLLPELPNASPESLDTGEKAARELISGLGGYFNGDRKPAKLADADWQKNATTTEALAHRALGWASWQRGDLTTAETELTKSLEKNPQDAEVSSWLGIVLSLENGKQTAAIWELARASNATAGTLADEQRRQVNGMLEHVYTSYHGGLDGLDDIRKASASSALPPPDFSVDSATTVAARRAETELSLTNPELASWLAIRRQLTAPDGQQYFASNLQAKTTPVLKGTVVRCTPAHSAKECSLSMAEGSGPEVTLQLSTPLTRFTAPGSKVSFHGTAESFTADPFNLVVAAEPNNIESSAAKGEKASR